MMRGCSRKRLLWFSVSLLVLLLSPCLTMAGAPATKLPEDMPLALCEVYADQVTKEDIDIYHGDHVCDRSSYNTFKASLERGRTYQHLKETKLINHIQNQKTVTCPLEVEDLIPGGINAAKQQQQPAPKGFDTVWIVENTSSEPIVLSFVHEQTGVEYSAIHSHITPPHSDPAAVLYPRHFRAIYTYDGHVFHARTFDPETHTLGPVVLQHRTGLIPVGAHAQDLNCPQDDPEPVAKKVDAAATTRKQKQQHPKPPKPETPVVQQIVQKHVQEDKKDPNMKTTATASDIEKKRVHPQTQQVVRQNQHNKPKTQRPKFRRTKPNRDRFCNAVDLGFRNMANCPLHAYFINTINGTTCQEQYKFHLGKNRDAHDFMWQWDSPTKFEGSYVGHAFAFRLAADPHNTLVETITIQPTRIIDCPNLKTTGAASRGKVQTNAVTTTIQQDLVSTPQPRANTAAAVANANDEPQQQKDEQEIGEMAVLVTNNQHPEPLLLDPRIISSALVTRNQNTTTTTTTTTTTAPPTRTSPMPVTASSGAAIMACGNGTFAAGRDSALCKQVVAAAKVIRRRKTDDDEDEDSRHSASSSQ